MPRTNKNFDGKRHQLLGKIWSIFLKRGYQDTTLSVIIKELGISKGVFYHYFDSKEHCALASVDFYSDLCMDRLDSHCSKEDPIAGTPAQNLKQLLRSGQQLFKNDAASLEGIHSPANKVFHQMLMVALTRKLSLKYAAVIQSGVEQGQFQTENPSEMAEMLLVLSNFYLDRGLFGWEAETMPAKILACQRLIAAGLGVEASAIF